MTSIPPVAVAMDWGGTWIRASVVERNGNVLWSSRVPTPKELDQVLLLEPADTLLAEAISWCSQRPIVGVGLAIAGPVDALTGVLYDPPNLPALNGVSLKARWEPKIGLDVLVGNDANLAALGEFHFGAGRDASLKGNPPQTLVYITVSTGIGGGVVERGGMFLGASGMAAEIGHMTIDMSQTALPCACGNRGCFEALASGTALGAIAKARASDPGEQVSELASEGVESITSESVFRAAAKGDILALDILDKEIEALAVGLTNVLHLYNPDLIVLGGGVTVGLSELRLLPRIQSLMHERAMSDRHREFSLVASKLGDGVGMAGAAALVWAATGSA